jgi:ATP-dependent exoDNAse (exonuclease V) beta subunit
LHGANEERKQRETEESHRLLYVAMTRAEQHLVLSFSGKGKQVKNWAKAVTEELGLTLDSPRDEVLTMVAPDGQEWKLRVLVAGEPPGTIPSRDREGAVLPESAAGVEWLAPPAAGGQQDANATVTAVASFAKCPREYYLGRYLGFEGRPAPGRDRRESATDDRKGAVLKQ